MSDSSSDGSFILDELGLNNGSAKEKDQPKKKAKPKSKKKQSPKRKPLSIDEIMKGMGLDTPADQITPAAASNQMAFNNDNALGTFDKNDDSIDLFPNKSKSQNIPLQQIIQAVPVQPQVNFTFFESRIIDYLNQGLHTIVDEFSIELTQLFQFNSQIEDMITSFLDSIKHTIREEINFLVELKSPLANCFDTFASEFRETYFEIERTKNLSIPKKVAQLRKATASISSYIPTINSRFAHTEVINELNELSAVRSQYKAAQKKLYQLKRNLFLNQVELECKSQTQKMESEIIQAKMQRLESDRSGLDIFEDDSNKSSYLDQNRKIRKLIHDLAIYIRKRKEIKPNWHLQEIKNTRNEINYYRQLNNYQSDLFESRYEEILNQRRTQRLLSNSMPPQSLNNTSLFLPQQSQILMPNSLIQPQIQQFQAQPIQQQQQQQQQVNYNKSRHRDKSPKVTEVSRSNLSGPELIEHVHKQLRKAQENNQTSLDITSHYLSSLKKKERKRAHQHVTQLLDSEYDMNSLFSIT